MFAFLVDLDVATSSHSTEQNRGRNAIAIPLNFMNSINSIDSIIRLAFDRPILSLTNENSRRWSVEMADPKQPPTATTCKAASAYPGFPD
jgi:hypothetical protein